MFIKSICISLNNFIIIFGRRKHISFEQSFEPLSLSRPRIPLILWNFYLNSFGFPSSITFHQLCMRSPLDIILDIRISISLVFLRPLIIKFVVYICIIVKLERNVLFLIIPLNRRLNWVYVTIFLIQVSWTSALITYLFIFYWLALIKDLLYFSMKDLFKMKTGFHN